MLPEANVLALVKQSCYTNSMEKRDLGVQPDYVDRAFKRVEALPECAPLAAKEYFMTRALQLQDLAHIQANRPLKRPGKDGWRFAASPMSLEAIAYRKLRTWQRLQHL